MKPKQTNKKKERLDNYLVAEGYFDNKSQAQGAILSGNVKVNGETVTKAGAQVKPENADIELKHMPYVSRGGFKLEKAVNEFNIDLKDRICLDIGASTGGFSDFMLQNGAQKIYAVDVGYGQLAWKLRNDPRVAVIERTNVRNASFSDIYADEDRPASFAAIDVSFISTVKILENVQKLMSANSRELVVLVKPQFEAGREHVPKSGVIKDKNVHIEAIKKVAEFAYTLGLTCEGATFSPIKGPAGNIEFLLYLKTPKNVSDCGKIDDAKIVEIVDKAHENL